MNGWLVENPLGGRLSHSGGRNSTLRLGSSAGRPETIACLAAGNNVQNPMDRNRTYQRVNFIYQYRQFATKFGGQNWFVGILGEVV